MLKNEKLHHSGSGVFELAEKHSSDFSLLSGDYNPMHLDSVYARRLQFGRTVVHGIHHLLATLNECASDLSTVKLGKITGISVRFISPVSVGDQIHYVVNCNSELNYFDIKTAVMGTPAMSAEVRIDPTKCRPEEDFSFIADETPIVQACHEQKFPPEVQAEEFEFSYHRKLGISLFPEVPRIADPGVISLLLASTNIVGMRCPGLHSIYAGFEFDFRDVAAKADSEISYRVKRADPRVNLLDIVVESDWGSGVINSFSRPPPVVQPSYRWFLDNVGKDDFVGQRALIIGGTRGIGETVAKSISAGGGTAVITYSTGLDDATRVCEDINENGGKCSSVQFDVLTGADGSAQISFDQFSHLYYLASPRIALSASKIWDDEKYKQYCSYYVTAFSTLMETFIGDRDRPLSVFYPSTIFIESDQKGFSEYVAAKNAGELLCKNIAANFQNVNMVVPRLPRLNTDQTIGLIQKNAVAVFDVVYDELKKCAM